MAVISGEGPEGRGAGVALCAADRSWSGFLSPAARQCTHAHLQALAQAHVCTRVDAHPVEAFRLLVPPRLHLRPTVPVPSTGPISAGRVPGWGPWGGAEGSSGDVGGKVGSGA